MAPETLAIDNIYEQLRSLVVTGYLRPGQVIVVQRIAQLFGVSISPVRDALQRMVGARLVDTLPGGGFRIPAISQSTLRYLYRWHSQIIVLAIGDRDRAAIATPWKPIVDDTSGGQTASATAALFDQISALSRNPEYLSAVRSTGDRLSFARTIETQIDDRGEELRMLWEAATSGNCSKLKRMVSDYHAWRLDHVDSIVDFLVGMSGKTGNV